MKNALINSAITVLILLLANSACCLLGGNYCSKLPPPEAADGSDTGALESLEIEILSKTMGYALGSPFDMKMRLTNNSDEAIELAFPDGRAFDFLVYQKDELIYRYSEDERYPTGLKEIVLEPGESKDYGGIWLCKDRDGVWVRGGRYQLVGLINADPPIMSEPLLFGLTD